jgi:hypothetical protein
MDQSTRPARVLATLGALFPLGLILQLAPLIKEIAELIQQYRSSDPTPQSTCDFECALNRLLGKAGRVILEWVYNHLEPVDPGLMPIRLHFAGEVYRRRRRTPNHSVATLFGPITLIRFLYQPLEPGEHSIFPLEICLGLEAGLATPALADRVGQYAAGCTQKVVLELLRRDHSVSWSVKTLRKVTACVSKGFAGHRHTAQVAKVLSWLEQADASRGNRKPVLAVGRDGIFLPIRKEREYREGATATVSVFDRAGRRLGTVYLGRMPESGQTTLSGQLNDLLRDVLTQWTGLLPRLVYVTDAGRHETDYYNYELKYMRNPHRPDEYLSWERVVDYYHACQYIAKLGEALFGTCSEGYAWAAKMRRWLKTKSGGLNRVLHSAAAIRHKCGLVGSARDYDKAYNYLRSRMGFMDYVHYRSNHLPISSGVTEAACKTVFTQRLKQSGMSWEIEGGQVITDLRVIYLSGIWEQVHDAHLSSKLLPNMRTQDTFLINPTQKAA